MNEGHFLRVIGRVESVFEEKFGVPRQSGLVPSARGRIVFEPEVPSDACRGLEEFSHLWVVFLFDRVGAEEERWMVRPPRLGGNEKKGVFATRSPFRPNRLGLSLLKLEQVGEGFLEVSGLDVVSGTPVFDVKPYLPYVESVPTAVGGFGEGVLGNLEVVFLEGSREGLREGEEVLIREVLAEDPRPRYHEEGRVYGCRLGELEVKWRVFEGKVEVISHERLFTEPGMG